jgi:TolB-like protein
LARPLRGIGFFLKELRRRHVVRVAGIYVVGAWVLIQAADVIGPAIGLPRGTVGVLFWLSIVGLAITVVMTWLFERTPEGVRRDPADVAEKQLGSEEVRRLMVLPFRVLRPDPETDFLAFSLPDAITCNLAGLRSLVVRSSAAAARFGASADLRELTREAGVDVVLTGSLLRAGNDLEVRAQLADAHDGELLWSHTSRASVGGLFELQEEMTRRVVDSLALPLTAGEARQLERDHPANARAYNLYLRANQLSLKMNSRAEALHLYKECLAEDSGYAPAWARIGHCYRVLAKYATDSATAHEQAERAEQSLLRALSLNPDLPLTHSIYADLEIDTDRAEQAMTRLLGRLDSNRAQPEILVGLVQACRYCGLLDASLRAHRLARQLDPQIRTGAAHTHFMLGDYEAALATINEADLGYVDAMILTMLGRQEEALALLRPREASTPPDWPVLIYLTSLRAQLEGKDDECIATIARWAPLQRDAEGAFYTSRQLAHLGAHDDALSGLERSLAGGYFCLPVVLRDPWLAGLRGHPRFEAYAERVRARHERAAVSFEVAGGLKLLGVPSTRGRSPEPAPRSAAAIS